MQEAWQHAAARRRIRAAADAADLIALQHLEVGDVVDRAATTDGLHAARHAQVEGLLAIGVITGGLVADHDDGQLALAQKLSECLRIDCGIGAALTFAAGRR
jgi:hypothetical protein